MDINIWLKESAAVFIGGDPSKGQHPMLTLTALSKPQIVVDEDKNTIVILETK